MGSGPTRLEAAVTERTRIFLYSGDPILQSGLAVQLRQRPEVVLVDADDVDSAQVAVVIADSVDEETLRVLHALQRGGVPRLVLLASAVDAGDLARAVEAGVCGVLRRREMTVDKLLSVILAAAAGDGSVPPDLLARLLDQVGRLQRQVLDPRGSGVLRADGARDRGAAAGRGGSETPPRSPAGWPTRSEPSRTSCTRSPPGSSCATGRTPSPTRSARASSELIRPRGSRRSRPAGVPSGRARRERLGRPWRTPSRT